MSSSSPVEAARSAASATPSTSSSSRSARVAQAGMVAATYAAATLVTLLLLQGLAWGPVQFRISEAVCVLALLTPAAVPGLTVGCLVANLIALVVNGTGALGLLDVVFGRLATFLGALWCWKMRERPKVALLGPVLANALIVPAYLPLMLQGLGFYTIPFTSIALDGAYLPMYLFGLVATGLGEALVMYVLGLPLFSALKRFNVAKRVGANSTVSYTHLDVYKRQRRNGVSGEGAGRRDDKGERWTGEGGAPERHRVALGGEVRRRKGVLRVGQPAPGRRVARGRPVRRAPLRRILRRCGDGGGIGRSVAHVDGFHGPKRACVPC